MKCFLLLLLALACGCATTGNRVEGIDNYDTVRDGVLCRGAQPSRRGVETLQERGIRTVINLRDDPPAWEERAVERAGMRYVRLPMKASRISQSDLRSFLDVLSTAQKPTFVHCRAGADRTGASVAAYRVFVEGQPRDAAIRELHAHGYHWLLYPGIEQLVREAQ